MSRDSFPSFPSGALYFFLLLRRPGENQYDGDQNWGEQRCHPSRPRADCGRHFFTVSHNVSGGFFIRAPHHVEEVPFYSYSVIYIYHVRVLDFVQCFSASTEMIMWT